MSASHFKTKKTVNLHIDTEIKHRSITEFNKFKRLYTCILRKY